MNRARELEKFIECYSDRGFRFAYQLCRGAEEAKELVQEAFFHVIRNWDKYDPTSNPESWFLTILRHVYYDAAKRYERKHCISLDSKTCDGEENAPSLADAIADARDESALARMERLERADRTREILNALIPEYKAVLTLCDMEGLSYTQIAAVLDCPLGTVRSRISRAREAFKEKFLELGREALEP